MHAYIRRGLQISLVVGGGILFSAQAHADDTSGTRSLLGGNQASAPVSVPVTVSGNAISVVGDSRSSSSRTRAGSGGSGAAASPSTTSGADSIAGGNQASAPVSVPVTVSGNAVSVLGDANTSGAATTSAAGPGGPADGATTGGEDSVLGGNQVLAAIGAPVSAGGNAVAVLGDARSTGAVTSSSPAPATSDDATSGEGSVGGGNQVGLPVTAPVTIGGTAVSVVGDATTEGSTTWPGGSTPVTPTEPTVPGAPTDPTVPSGPTSPTDPSDPVSPSDPTQGRGDSATTPSRGGAATRAPLTAAANASLGELAQTGTEVALLLAVGTALLALGSLILAGAGRRRAVLA